MRLARSRFAMLGLTAVLSCWSPALPASEVLDILSDLDGDFRGCYRQLIDYQSKVDHVQLATGLERNGPPLTRLAGDIDAIGGGATRAVNDLRAKVSKLDELQATLEERFPEDRDEIRRYFKGYGSLLARSEVLYQAIREDLEQARKSLLESRNGSESSEQRETLLTAIKERLRKRDQALAEASREAAVEDEIREQAREHVEQAPDSPPAGAIVSELGHAPVGRRVVGEKTQSSGSPITVDLEQLIQEMEK